MKKDISDRNDIELLVRTFYSQIRVHEVLGPIFNNAISDWEHHIFRISDFWQTNLLFVPGYKGNPVQKHIDLDKKTDHIISQAHFGHWIQLWFETLDALFEGEKQRLAKERARNMSHMMFMRIFMARDEQKNS